MNAEKAIALSPGLFKNFCESCTALNPLLVRALKSLGLNKLLKAYLKASLVWRRFRKRGGVFVVSEVMRLVNVTKTYVMGAAKFKALKDVNLTIPRGAFMAIMGPSGSGKTTLLNIMGLLDRPTSGKVYIDGLDTSRLSDREIARIRNEKIGFVFQQYNLVGRLTVLENIELPLIVRGIPRSKRVELAKEAIIEAGGDLSWLNKRPSQLSGGEQQRVAIARAIVTSPSIVLADEPTGNLDTQTSGRVIRTFIDINKMGNTIVMVTHNSEVANCAQKIYVIRDGAIVGVREPERDKCIGSLH